MGNSQSSQSKIYSRSCIVTKDEVIEEIKRCKKFGWSWSEGLTGVHHTAILLYLDDSPSYTVNWTPKNGTKMGSILHETRGQLVFENESLKSCKSISYKQCLQKYDIREETDIYGKFSMKFEKLLNKLMSFQFTAYENYDGRGNAKFYDLTICNCRDHVISVMRQVYDLTRDRKLLSSIKEVEKVKKSGAEPVMYGLTAVKASIVDVALIPVYSVFSGFSVPFMRRYFGRLRKKLKPAA